MLISRTATLDNHPFGIIVGFTQQGAILNTGEYLVIISISGACPLCDAIRKDLLDESPCKLCGCELNPFLPSE